MPIEKREEQARGILTRLYEEGFVETIYNSQHPKHQREGWTLKNGMWSPWYLNLRPIGASPKLVTDIALAMNQMICEEFGGLDQLIGIEMAGVPLVAAIATVSGPRTQLMRYSYTRPLAEKIRTPDELKAKMQGTETLYGYGEKELVEGRFRDGESICLVDDMVTNFGSKLIAKMLTEYELKKRGVKDYKIEHAVVVLDREMGAEEEAGKENMQLRSLIKFKTKGLDWLKDRMHPEEHELLTDYQEHPEKYSYAKGKEMREEVIRRALKARGIA